MRTPDWQSDDGAIQLYCCDCLDLLPTIPAGAVDAVVTDPPYDIAVGAAFVRRNCAVVADGNEAANAGDTWAWAAHAACIRPGGNVAAFHKRGDRLPAPFIEWHRFYLVKQAPPPTPRPCFVSAVEECSIGATPGPRRWFGGGYVPNYWLGMTPNRLDESVGHPTEKPITAIQTLVEALSCVGELIADPFLGSGTTAIACIRTGRRFIGCEIEQRYFDIAVRRVKAELAQPRLFTAPAPKPEQTRMFP